jgi:hypothetical protein
MARVAHLGQSDREASGTDKRVLTEKERSRQQGGKKKEALSVEPAGFFRCRFSALLHCGLRYPEKSLHSSGEFFKRWLAFGRFGLHASTLARIRDRRVARHLLEERSDHASRSLRSFRQAFCKREKFLEAHVHRCSRNHTRGSWCQDLALPLAVQDLPQRPPVAGFYSIRQPEKLGHSIYRGAAVS